MLDLLKRYFGFTSFRPLQQEIISNAMTGRDVFALLSTGGGGRFQWKVNENSPPDGLRIVTGSFDKTAKVWQAASKARVASGKQKKQPQPNIRAF